jgi:hypothetical protein
MALIAFSRRGHKQLRPLSSVCSTLDRRPSDLSSATPRRRYGPVPSTAMREHDGGARSQRISDKVSFTAHFKIVPRHND